jgi:hypothetical protein
MGAGYGRAIIITIFIGLACQALLQNVVQFTSPRSLEQNVMQFISPHSLEQNVV